MSSYYGHSRPAGLLPLSRGAAYFGGCFVFAGLGKGMRYTKPATTFEHQADILMRRGLIAPRDTLINRLRSLSYFRLSTYLFHFRQPGRDDYVLGTTLDRVLRLYEFDKRLRVHLIEAIETIEVHTRTQLAYHLGNQAGPFAYLDPANLPNLTNSEYMDWRRKLDSQIERSRRSQEDFLVHFFGKYGDEHDHVPVWMLVEQMDFGATLTLFRGVKDDIKKLIGAQIGIPDRVVFSWLISLNSMRNRCAHHARVWDWEMGTQVLLPRKRKFPLWHSPGFPNNRVGILLTICRFWQEQIQPRNAWTRRLYDLFDQYPDLDVLMMGLNASWREHPLWTS